MSMRTNKWAAIAQKAVCWLLLCALAFGYLPAGKATASGEEVLVNWLAQDMDTGFDSGTSPFTLDKNEPSGSQHVVQVGGNNAVEFRDASLGSNVGSYFYYQLSSGALVSRINDIYKLPAGSEPVEFVYAYRLRRSAASDKPVNADIYSLLQFGNYDNVLVPRFPVPDKQTITGTAAYLNTAPDELKTVNDQDIASYRFQIVPNGGQRLISSLKIAFSVRVNTGGTDEAIVVDDLALYEVTHDASADTEAPSAPTGLTAAAKTDTSVSLSWTAATDNVGVTRYDVYQDGQLAGTAGGTVTSYSVIGLSPNATYHYTVKARDAAGNVSAPSAELAVTTNPSASGLPEPFGDRDVGTVNVAGSAGYAAADGSFTVRGSGADIWGTDDAFHYVYRPWTGDGQIVARVGEMTNTVAWSKAGVMIRANMTSQSPHATMAVSPSNGVFFEDRLTQGGATTLTSGPVSPAPYWVKLTRAGNMIAAYASPDGVTWSLVKREAVNLPETVYFGLALTSHDNKRLSTAKFDHVAIGDIPPADSGYSPFPGTLETRKQWLWDKTKSMSEIGGQPNIVQIVAQLMDNQNVAVNLQKLDTMFQTYDWEQYKTVSKMYAYLLVGDKFDSAMLSHVKSYFAGYAYAKLPQTENLRMSNYTAGYLVGQIFPDVVDLNGASGAALKSANRANIEEMLNAAVRGGWAEYESPEYTYMTYLCLNALYQYSDEPDFRQKVKMAMDVMWFEWANDWIGGTFVSSTSRAKGDSVSASDPTWRGADHTLLSWMYFGAHRAQQGFGDTDAMVPAAYRPFLEYLGLLIAPGTSYAPPEMAVRIGQKTDKDYVSRKTNLQNSSGRAMSVYRQAYVKPTWGLASEVTYDRVDNWIENIQVALRWQSAKPDSLFRVNADQGDSPIGNYDQPENHRIMQDGKTAVGVYKSLSAPGATDNYLNAMFPDTGSILTKEEQGGWVFSKTEQMYFAFRMIKPYAWYTQSPTDPANKVKTTTQLHPTKQLSYSYNILRSQADNNGWVLETAGLSEYADFAAFKNAVLTGATVDSSHIDEDNPRLIYTNLSGHTMDITFDRASGAYAGTHKVNGQPIGYTAFKLFDTPWLQQDRGATIFTATEGNERLTYDFGSWTVTASDPNAQVPVSGVALGASTLTVGAGKTAALTAVVSPANASNKKVLWSSSSQSIAALSAGGTVTGVAPGTAVITATTEDGAFTAAATVTVTAEPLFQDTFAGGLGNWDLFGSTAWEIQGTGQAAVLKGTTTSTGPQRAVVKTSVLPYSAQNYTMAFGAESDRFRALFRYSSSTNYYFMEFKNTNTAELWKYASSSTPAQVGTTVNIGAVLPGFDLTAHHAYEIKVDGSAFKLTIDGVAVTTFNDTALTAGGIGFSVKGAGTTPVQLLVDDVTVMPNV